MDKGRLPSPEEAPCAAAAALEAEEAEEVEVAGSTAGRGVRSPPDPRSSVLLLRLLSDPAAPAAAAVAAVAVAAVEVCEGLGLGLISPRGPMRSTGTTGVPALRSEETAAAVVAAGAEAAEAAKEEGKIPPSCVEFGLVGLEPVLCTATSLWWRASAIWELLLRPSASDWSPEPECESSNELLRGANENAEPEPEVGLGGSAWLRSLLEPLLT